MKINKQTCGKSLGLKYLLLFISVIIILSANSQARIVINNASFININNGSFLVIDNSATNAITRIGTTGWIISEGNVGNNRVVWKVGATNSTFTVPFGHDITIDLPLTITTSGAVGNGNIIFSTYRSGVNSANLPQAGAVIPQTMFPTNYLSVGIDNSAFGVDRFYQIDATDAAFTSKPSLSNIIFSYATAEFDASITANTIIEGNLQAQFWDTIGVDDWSPFPLGTATTASNIVTVPFHSASLVATSKWWSLVDNAHPLPISLLDFKVECLGRTVGVKWSTASELNNDFFTIERSMDGISWQAISMINGAGNSSSLREYSFIDVKMSSQTTYYRLRQTDFDGTSTTSSIIAIGDCDQNISNLNTNAYFNTDQQNIQVFIDSDVSSAFSISIYNTTGGLVALKNIVSFIGENKIVFEGMNKPDGMYMVVIRKSGKFFTHKIIINKS